MPELIQCCQLFEDPLKIKIQMYEIIKEKISDDEKAFFQSNLQDYKDEIIPLSSIIRIIQSWAIRFENSELMDQTLFEPFPNQLIKNPQSEGRKDMKLLKPTL